MPEPIPLSTSQAAGEALAALERYQLHAGRLAADWRNLDLYRQVAADLDQIRDHCKALPQLSGAWVALLIAHAEWMDALRRSVHPGETVTQEERTDLLAQALARVAAIGGTCMQLLRVPGSGGR